MDLHIAAQTIAKALGEFGFTVSVESYRGEWLVDVTDYGTQRLKPIQVANILLALGLGRWYAVRYVTPISVTIVMGDIQR